MSDPLKDDAWNCGGWEAADREKLKRMAALTFEEKIHWLEETRALAASIKEWRRSRGLPTITQNDEIVW